MKGGRRQSTVGLGRWAVGHGQDAFAPKAEADLLWTHSLQSTAHSQQSPTNPSHQEHP